MKSRKMVLINLFAGKHCEDTNIEDRPMNKGMGNKEEAETNGERSKEA